MKLSKAYQPQQHEAAIYELWEKAGAFQPKGEGTPYSLVIPPPNANGDLHIGHALTFGVEDVAVRFHRLLGDKTLMLPGADHAGFETWVVYEKQLEKAGKSRFDFRREELYQQVWDFVAQNREKFSTQLRRLGISADWDYFTFTLDKKIVNQAYNTFQKMWNEGLIYRGKRLVNFCTFHGTAFADIEVAYKEEKGKLWHIRYPLSDGSGHLEVATTRPETMLGDTAVAVNPNDKRYTAFIGKTVTLPLTGREIPIIADDFVDQSFGTGAVKVTPAHDFTDFEVGLRHNLPLIQVITHLGAISDDMLAAYRGLKVLESRKKVVDDLEAQGYLVQTEDITHSVGHCYKCNTVIEPLLREQWFVDMKKLAANAISALEANKITFYPESKKTQLIEYLRGLKDWNISRQIAWGIPIPAFQNVDDPDEWIYDERVTEEVIMIGDKTYHRDPDVFDTWFSSSSWPYATLGYPNTAEYKEFYPLSVMETGGEILYPWVSRMIMLGLYVTGKVPFHAVYVHGYVLAEDGAKMSKSLGNVINPLEVIDKYGSDALRMGILASRVPAINRGYDSRKVEDARNFSNKLWNIARFIQDKVGENSKKMPPLVPSSSADFWILDKLSHVVKEVEQDLRAYQFAEAYEKIYHFVWDDYADWYIESAKVLTNVSVLLHSLEAILQITHPFAPFLSETIWQTLEWRSSPLLITSHWPKTAPVKSTRGADFEDIKQIVSAVRFYAKALGIQRPILSYKENEFTEENRKLIKLLTKASHISSVSEISQGLRITSGQYDMYLEIDKKMIDDYLEELANKKEQEVTNIAQLKKRLSNKAYVENAPKQIVEASKEQLTQAEQTLKNLNQEEQRFKNL